MRYVCRLIVLTCFVFLTALASHAQTRFNFPRILTPTELTTTGFAFVNPSSTQVTATFNAYTASGSLAGQSILNVPAKGQVAKLASEVLPLTGSNVWVQVTSASSELQGFELIGDFATVLDGAGPAAESTQLAVVKFSKEDVIYMVNPGPQAATVQLRLNASNGSALTTQSVSLNPFQSSLFRLGDLNNDDNIGLVSITSNVAVSASLTTKLAGGNDVGVTNATASANAPSDLFFPFAPSGPQGGSNWRTLLGITNVGATTQTVSITFNSDGSTPVTIQRNLASGASVGDSVGNLFSLSSTAFSAGWIRVNGAGPLVGSAAYQDSAAGSLAIVPSQSSGSTRFLFGHIANLSPWYTGVALLNTTTTTANVEVHAIEPNGEAIGSATFSLSGSARRTALLSEFVPSALQRQSDGGWLFIQTTNNVPLLGFELFGQGVAPILANVQGFALASNSTFTPPVKSSIGGVGITEVKFTDGTNPKTSFTAASVINYIGTLSNSTGASVTVDLNVTITDPRGQTFFSSPGSISIPAGGRTATVVSIIPSNALNGEYTATFSIGYLGQTATRSAVFTVTGGTTTPSVGQETPISLSSTGGLQSVFRPGDVLRFGLVISNFTGQQVNVTLNYSLTGPGALAAGSGAVTIAAPAGLSTQLVDTLSVPTSAPQGLFLFSSSLALGGATSTKTTLITVVPRTSAEATDVEHVYVSDSAGVPKGGFATGSSALLNLFRINTAPLSMPATVRYSVTGPGNASILEQPLQFSVGTGGSLGNIALTISSAAAAGSYTFQGSITHDTTTGPRTSTKSTTFTVGSNPAALKEEVINLRPYVADINAITRSSFSPGETIFFVGTTYSTFPATTSGTIRYSVTGPTGTAFDQTYSYSPKTGANPAIVIVTTGTGIPPGTYTLTIISTVQGVASTNSTTFAIAGGLVPGSPLTQADSATEMSSINKAVIVAPLIDAILDDGLKSLQVPDAVDPMWR